MNAGLPDPQTLKQIIDYLGYTLTGLAGVITAWKRMRKSAVQRGSPWRRRGAGNTVRREQIKAIEEELSYLRKRQDHLQDESAVHQSELLKQQTAIFDLLLQQRGILDKILGKMGGLG